MFAAQNLVRALLDNGVDTCFTNPGTSEMHMVAALDQYQQMHSVLCLFEGVASAAADGYGRVKGTPACTLLHLGPGVGNGLANFHNARKAASPIVNIVGDHARDHLPLDAPLTSDVEGICRPVSKWVQTVKAPEEIGDITIEAIIASQSGVQGVSSLIIPADCAWAEVMDSEHTPTSPKDIPSPALISDAHKAAGLAALKTAKNPIVYIGGKVCNGEALEQAAKLAHHFGAKLIIETFPAKLSRGEGRAVPTKLGYFVAQAERDLENCDLLFVIGTKPPVSFFAYPNAKSELTPDSAKTFIVGGDDVSTTRALADMVKQIGANDFERAVYQAPIIEDEALDLSPKHVGAALCRHMPQGSIICDDSNTSGAGVYPLTQTAKAHDWLCLTGGAIGIGLPMAVGAACAAPDAQIIALSGDGAAAYTLQALWTQAREKQNIINIIFANHSYRILNIELKRVGAGEPGKAAKSMLDLSDPKMDWVKLGEGFGVPSVRANTVGEFEAALIHAVKTAGPHLIVAEI